jgi:release factor glutamine methyltransferase
VTPPSDAPDEPPPALVARLRAAGCVYAEDEARLLLDEASTPAHLESLVARRVAGLPLEQVLGWAEFCGLRLVVAPGVFVPRRRTGLLVREAAALLAAVVEGRDGREGLVGQVPVVVDLCCGTGAVGAALAVAAGPLELHAVDVDPAAVRCAERNLAASGGRVHRGDLDEPLPADLRGRVDVLVANAPYVPTSQVPLMPPEARDHEHRVALDGGPDGLDVQRRVVAAAPGWLAPGGHVLVETSERQAPDSAAALVAAGLLPRVVRADDLDGTVVVGTLPVLAEPAPSGPDGPVRTPDGRYLVVRGRLWRCADPTLDPAEREALVAELMSARRDKGAAMRRGDAGAREAARARVDAAKHALGERGPVWWSTGEPDLTRRLARTTPYADWFAGLP